LRRGRRGRRQRAGCGGRGRGRFSGCPSRRRGFAGDGKGCGCRRWRRRGGYAAAMSYMALTPGKPLEGMPVDVVFIGSCTNSRLSDLQGAAALVRGRHVASGVRAIVVPGSTAVRAAAEREGIDAVFRDAGFEWREAGCSMCLAINDDVVAPGARCVSTSNRNFEGRQGPGARTHLASPLTAVATAIAGRVADPAKLA